MPTAIEEFFGELGRREYLPTVAKMCGSVRFDLAGDDRVDHWLMVVDHGHIRVSRESAPADCTMRAHVDLFEKVVTGRANAMTAYLRGAADATGNTELLVYLRRIFPG
jgi:putative sterol carrier protein